MAMQTNELDPQVVEYLVSKIKKAEDLFGDGSILKQLKKALTERILEGELSTELCYKKHDSSGKNSGNSRNGYSQKTLKTKDGTMEIQIPRDRMNQYEPQLIPKNRELPMNLGK